MMVVTVEVWPGGRVLHRRVIGTLNIGNVSQLADVSDYKCVLDGSKEFKVKGHRRSDGAWALVRKALAAAEEA